MKKFIYLIFLLIFIVNAYSYFDNSSHGTTASTILKLNINASCQAMGEACAGSISDASALTINPANLVKIKKSSLFISNNIYFEDINLKSIYYARNLGKNVGAIAAGIKYLKWGEIPKTNNSAEEIGTFSPNDFVIEFGFSAYLTGLTKDPEDRITFGGVGKFIQNKIENSATTLSADIAFNFPYLFERKFMVSLIFQNIVGKIKMDKEDYDITKIIKVGSSIFLTPNLTINADIISPQDSLPYLALGLESRVNFTKYIKLFLRTGANSRNISGMKGFRGVNFGFGFKYYEYFLNYSYSPFGEFGNIHHLSFSLNY